jgi:PIN domain nuclease of toxin-antitoxin system
MRLLLDTHTVLWWLEGSARLGKTARIAIGRDDALVWISAASAWEIAIKIALGRLSMREPPEECLPREFERSGFQPLAITVDHALAVRALPNHHPDPFDRLLIAQANLEALTIVTADAAFQKYRVSTLDATR